MVLGRSGRNFAAGMSGGIAYVLDEAGDFRTRCNVGMVDLEPLEEEEDVEQVKDLIMRHIRYTKSALGERVLIHWDELQPRFVKIYPRDYKRALGAMKKAQEQGIPWETAVMEGAHG